MSNPLKLKQLTYFIAVAEELSFRRAAERLFITQPPLSRQIRMLEDSLGIALFDRDQRSVRLTEAGTRLLVDARSLVNESEQIRARFSPGRNAVLAELTLGITTVIDASLFAWVEAAFAQRFPGVRLRVKRQISSQSIRDLNRGHLDVAVIGLPSRAEDLTTTHLFDDRLVACMASDHPAARKRLVSIREFAQDKLFWFDRKLNPAYHDQGQATATGCRPVAATAPAPGASSREPTAPTRRVAGTVDRMPASAVPLDRTISSSPGLQNAITTTLQNHPAAGAQRSLTSSEPSAAPAPCGTRLAAPPRSASRCHAVILTPHVAWASDEAQQRSDPADAVRRNGLGMTFVTP